MNKQIFHFICEKLHREFRNDAICVIEWNYFFIRIFLLCLVFPSTEASQSEKLRSETEDNKKFFLLNP